MAREKTLLERLADAGRGGRSRVQPSAEEDLTALMESVRRQLARILNARHGMSEAMPEYGLPALTDLTIGTGDHSATVEQAIRTAIEKYEPRLRRVRVTRVQDEERNHVWAYRVDAVLSSETGDHRVWYETQVRGSGEFNVSD